MKEMSMNYITRCLRWLANSVEMEYHENTMSPLLKDKTNKFYDCVSKALDWYSLTRDDFLSLGFMCYGYEEDDPNELWLIPQWLYPCIPEGILLEDLDNKTFNFNRKTTPHTTFYGCMTYGIKISNPSFGKSIDDLLNEEITYK